ncbi:hypothetical protein OG897_19765 [Streptomyces sp. NBC_00237]|uniref:DUF6269 family protein n=1 Tax=Streptomyces sp. NBC_00237 TaxID=2975687 RepID=UPI002259327E|nr:DUF6269 family protein [Streptomyces sp. NBC_00237]MCX5203681.1 hypothetical protein [Streptomyces sp. NBC_00237]
MFDNQSDPAQVQHPLEVLADIEHRGSQDQEMLLRDSGTPWAELLAEYVDALNELASPGTGSSGFIATYGLDEGHAGGCG